MVAQTFADCGNFKLDLNQLKILCFFTLSSDSVQHACTFISENYRPAFLLPCASSTLLKWLNSRNAPFVAHVLDSNVCGPVASYSPHPFFCQSFSFHFIFHFKLELRLCDQPASLVMIPVKECVNDLAGQLLSQQSCVFHNTMALIT